MSSMPPEGWIRFNHEKVQKWPEAVKHWKVTFLPKSSSPEIDKFRPLSIGSIVYRLWERCRVQDYGRLVDSHLGKLQAGPDCDCEVLHLVMNGEYPGSRCGYGLGLDYTKAFASLAAVLFERSGLPPPVLGLVKDEWLGQQRWLSVAGSVSPHCLRNVPSLPQGDSSRRLPNGSKGFPHKLLVLSTSTIARSWPPISKTLRDVYQEWEILSTVTRLRTSPSKTQCWARSSSAARWLQEHDPGFPVVSAAEILGYVVGLNPEDHPKIAVRRAKNAKIAARLALLPAGKKDCHSPPPQLRRLGPEP